MTKVIRRLALFLDGTWSTEEDRTNVFNAYTATKEGSYQMGNDSIVQLRYYDQGVGTSMFDSFSGGAFGIGLDKNIMQAYNWLVDHYEDGDEIYIFGFSRGAYTARSLVGFIGACGILKRGAPLTHKQLWEAYQLISYHRTVNDKSIWEALLAKTKNRDKFRRLTDILGTNDPSKLLTNAEVLIRQWSHRCNDLITYLGVFDTVGALGVKALGIPGIQGRWDKSHNLFPSTIINSCRHALAIDEYRPPFNNVPFINYVHHRSDFEDAYDDYSSFYNKIKQAWFPGAHSNIGGGYPTNVLSIAPFKWIMRGACEEGLVLHDEVADYIEDDQPVSINKDQIRDSYNEFGGAFVKHVLREKRKFRSIGKEDVIKNQYSLISIDEEVDPSAHYLLSKDKTYAPAHLLANLRRNDVKAESNQFKENRQKLSWPGEQFVKSDNQFYHSWKGSFSILLIAFWAIIASLGFISLQDVFQVKVIDVQDLHLLLFSTIFIFIDWGESQSNVRRNFIPKPVFMETLWQVCFWLRLFAFALFLLGALQVVGEIYHLLKDFGGWDVPAIFKLIVKTADQILNPSLLYALSGSLLLTILLSLLTITPRLIHTREDQNLMKVSSFIEPKKDYKRPHFLLNVCRVLSLIVLVILFVYKGSSVQYGQPLKALAYAYQDLHLLLITIMLLIFYLLFRWVSQPLSFRGANIGSILDVQGVHNTKNLQALFSHWINCLRPTYFDQEDQQISVAWRAVRQQVRMSIWRDILGFVPFYSLLFFVFFFIACTNGNGEQVIQTLPLGLDEINLLILAVFLFDQFENAIHLRHVDRFPTKPSSNGLIFLGNMCSLFKLTGFIILVLLSMIVLARLIIVNLFFANPSWIGNIATITSYFFIGILLYKGISFFRNKYGRKLPGEDYD